MSPQEAYITGAAIAGVGFLMVGYCLGRAHACLRIALGKRP